MGAGKRRLLAAIDWLLDVAGVAQVCLNVYEDLQEARQLYASVGFEFKTIGVGFSKQL